MTSTKPLPSLDYLNECFELSEESPSGLVWKVRPRSHFPSERGWNQVGKGCAGKSAGSVFTSQTGKQYWQVQISHQPCYVHRVILALLTNNDLSVDIEVDHEDGDGLNNAHNNLRSALSFQNSHNTQTYKSNLSGYKGVSYCKRGKSWMGRVMCRGELHHIRGCPTPEIANALLQELRTKLHKEFTNHGNQQPQ